MKKKLTATKTSIMNGPASDQKEAQEFQSPKDIPNMQRQGGSRRKAKQVEKRETQMAKMCDKRPAEASVQNELASRRPSLPQIR